MKRLAIAFLSMAILLPMQVLAQQEESYDYWQHQREMVRRGQHAIFMCNGLFTSERTLDQLYDWELEFFRDPIGNPSGGVYNVDWDKLAVEIGAPGRCLLCVLRLGRALVVSLCRRIRIWMILIVCLN